MNAVRVLLVDRNDDFLDGLSAWLSGEPGVEVVGSARTGVEGLELVERLHPDLVLIDVSMSSMNGFEATRRIKGEAGAPTVIMTTFHASETARHEAWTAGADGLLAKVEVTARLKELIRDIAAGRPIGAGTPLEKGLRPSPSAGRKPEGEPPR